MGNKAYKITMSLIQDTKYMYIDLVAGIYSTLIYRYKLEHSNETVHGMMSAIEEYYWNNIEPEWASKETEEFWYKMNIDYFTKYPHKTYNYQTGKNEDHPTYFHYKWAVDVPKKLLAV